MRTRATAIAGVMAMVMAASACKPVIAPLGVALPAVAASESRPRSVSAGEAVGGIVGCLGGIAAMGGLGAAALEDSLGRHGQAPTSPREELTVAAIGATVMVLGFVAVTIARRNRAAAASRP